MGNKKLRGEQDGIMHVSWINMNQKSVVANKRSTRQMGSAINAVFMWSFSESGIQMCLGRITIDGSLGSQQWGVE